MPELQFSKMLIFAKSYKTGVNFNIFPYLKFVSVFVTTGSTILYKVCRSQKFWEKCKMLVIISV